MVVTRSAAPSSSAAVLLTLAGLLLVAYPMSRPYGDLTTAGAADAFASPAWLVAHLAAVVAFVLLGLVMRRYGRAAEVTWWAGAGLVLPYYGAESLALSALGSRMSGDELAVAAEAIRLGPAAATGFVAGLVAFAGAGVLVVVRERIVALPFAVGLVLFLPQFFAPPSLRIAHGVLLGLGCGLLAWRARSGQRSGPSPVSRSEAGVPATVPGRRSWNHARSG